MSKLKPITIYLPLGRDRMNDMSVCYFNRFEEPTYTHKNDVVETEGIVLTEDELKKIISEAFDAGKELGYILVGANKNPKDVINKEEYIKKLFD